MSIERDEALSIADKILDRADAGNLDPDADITILARQLRRMAERAEKAIELVVRYGGIDGDHHKAWVIDQVVRLLAQDEYARVVANARAGRDGPHTYNWNVGIVP